MPVYVNGVNPEAGGGSGSGVSFTLGVTSATDTMVVTFTASTAGEHLAHLYLQDPAVPEFTIGGGNGDVPWNYVGVSRTWATTAGLVLTGWDLPSVNTYVENSTFSYVGGTQYAHNMVAIATDSSGVFRRQFRNFDTNTAYSFKVVAVGSDGIVHRSSTITLDTWGGV